MLPSALKHRDQRIIPWPPLAARLLAAALLLTALVAAGCGDSDRGGEDAGSGSDAGADAGRDGSADAGECAELGEDCSTVSCCDELRCVGVALPGMMSMQCEAE